MPITVNGKVFGNASEAARAIYAEGVEKSSTAIAKIIQAAGGKITPQTVYSQTAGKDKVQSRKAKNQVIKLDATKKYSAGMLAKRSGIQIQKVVSMLKDLKIVVPTAEELAIQAKESVEKVVKVVKPVVARKKKTSTPKETTVIEDPIVSVETIVPVAQSVA